MNRIGALGLLAAVATVACTGTGAYVAVPLPATAIVVDPAEFLGNVPCFPVFDDSSVASGSGAMRRYVATLKSVHAGGALDSGVVDLPSSPPTRCSDRVSFQRVVDGTAYVAEIDGYDVDDIKPLGTDGILGSRVMVDDQNRFVRPRWRTTCGLPKGARRHEPTEVAPPDATTADAATADAATADAATADAATADAAAADAAGAADARPPTTARDARAESLDTGVEPYGRCTGHALKDGEIPDLEGPVCAIANVAIPMRGCEPLREVNPPSAQTTALVVDLKDALSAPTLADGGGCLSCGDGPGQVATFRVELDGSSAPPRTAACADPLRFELPAGTAATFTITAYGSGASPGAGACSSPAPATRDAAASAVSADASACTIDRQLERGNAGLWCTHCLGRAASGVTLRAACDPLAGAPPGAY